MAFGFCGFCGFWLWWLLRLLASMAFGFSVAFGLFGFCGFWLLSMSDYMCFETSTVFLVQSLL